LNEIGTLRKARSRKVIKRQNLTKKVLEKEMWLKSPSMEERKSWRERRSK
jgi:hypothetical protein